MQGDLAHNAAELHAPGPQALYVLNLNDFAWNG
jgi:hypothetical protein